jgi:hypothetical protein
MEWDGADMRECSSFVFICFRRWWLLLSGLVSTLFLELSFVFSWCLVCLFTYLYLLFSKSVFNGASRLCLSCRHLNVLGVCGSSRARWNGIFCCQSCEIKMFAARELEMQVLENHGRWCLQAVSWKEGNSEREEIWTDAESVCKIYQYLYSSIAEDDERGGCGDTW